MQDGTGMTPARSDMRRANATAMRHVNAMAGGFRIAGYASLFGIGDLAGDRILPGAFENALRRRGAGGVRMLYQHDQGQPVGVWTMIREDRIGLYVEGELTPGVARAREVHGLMIRAGALDGLSIGFRCMRAAQADAGRPPVRRILEADLLGDLGGDISDAAGRAGDRRQGGSRADPAPENSNAGSRGMRG